MPIATEMVTFAEIFGEHLILCVFVNVYIYQKSLENCKTKYNLKFVNT